MLGHGWWVVLLGQLVGRANSKQDPAEVEGEGQGSLL